MNLHVPMFEKNDKLILVVNDVRYFLSHRAEIAKIFVEKGGEVDVVFLKNSSKDFCKENLADIDCYSLISRSFCALMVKVFISNFALSSKTNYIFHVVTITNILLLSPLFLFCLRSRFVWSVAGLGRLFDKNFHFFRVTRSIIILYMYLCCRVFRNDIIVQNSRDLRYLSKFLKLPKNKFHLTRGSGWKPSEVVSHDSNLVKKRVVFAGRLLKQKGCMDFLDACEAMPDDVAQNWQFLIFGEYIPNARGYISKAEYERIIASKTVQFLGFVDNLELELQSTALFVYPSTYNEGIPKTMIEAAAAGSALLAYRTPFAKEIIEEEVNGLLARKGSVNELADQLYFLLSNPAKILALGQKSRKKIKNEFMIKSVQDVHLSIYKDLLA